MPFGKIPRKKTSLKPKVGDSAKTDLVKAEKRLTKLEKEVHKIDKGIEYKQFDMLDLAGFTFSTAPLIGVITENIIQGINQDQRIGDKIKLLGLEGRVQVDDLRATGNRQLLWRFMLLMDRQANSVYPTDIDIWGRSPPTILGMMSRRSQQQDRFKVLLDKTMGVSPGLAEGAYKGNYLFKFNVKLNHLCNYYDPAAIQAAAGKNALYFVAYAEATSTDVHVYTTFRVTYTDA